MDALLDQATSLDIDTTEIQKLPNGVYIDAIMQRCGTLCYHMERAFRRCSRRRHPDYVQNLIDSISISTDVLMIGLTSTDSMDHSII